jgi:hypothetical protein
MLENKTKVGGAQGILPAILAAFLLAACGMLPPRGGSDDAGDGGGRRSEPGPAQAQPAPADRFEQPGELDRLVDAKPLPFPAVKTAASPGTAAAARTAPEAATGKGRFRIQVGAENDIDAAQARKRELERTLGGTVDVVFDAPYYKLRWGYFETKRDADDKILEISEFKVQGFVVKQ